MSKSITSFNLKKIINSKLVFKNFKIRNFSSAIDLSENQSLEALIKESDLPVMVDFYADWCGPCKKLVPVLDKKLEENQGKFKLVKVNVDNHQELAIKHNVMGVPTVFLFNNNELVETFVGFDLNKLDKMINVIQESKKL